MKLLNYVEMLTNGIRRANVEVSRQELSYLINTIFEFDACLDQYRAIKPYAVDDYFDNAIQDYQFLVNRAEDRGCSSKVLDVLDDVLYEMY